MEMPAVKRWGIKLSKKAIKKALDNNLGDRKKTAAELGVSYWTVKRRIKKLKIKVKDYYKNCVICDEKFKVAKGKVFSQTCSTPCCKKLEAITNKDRYDEYNQRPETKQRANARAADKYAENPEFREECKKRSKETKAKLVSTPEGHAHKLAVDAAWRATPEGRKSMRASAKRMRQKYPDRKNADTAKRRAGQKEALLPDSNPKLMKEFYTLAKLRTEETGVPHQVDHMLATGGKFGGGAHHQGNLQVVTKEYNQEKNDTYDPERYPEQLNGVWANNDLARRTKKKLGIK